MLNLADPAVHAQLDLRQEWDRLRREEPVSWHEPVGTQPGFWVLTRHSDLVNVYRDRGFTSERGNMLDTLLTGGDTGAGQMIAVSDGRRHAELRKLVAQAFSPRALKAVEQSVRSSTMSLVRQAAQRGEVDFAAEVAAQIPLTAICDLLGVPEADRQQLLGLTSGSLGSHGEHDRRRTWAARNELLVYFSGLAARRRERPLPDVTSLLANALIDGKPLTEAEVILNCYSIILGGDETGRMAMVGAAAAFVEHPEQWHRLVHGSTEIETAVEEVLRWTTPAMHSGRTATEDVMVGDRKIQAGEIVSLWNIAANFDEREFDDPERFELRRAPNRHLAFGFGPHFCIGAYLARVEIAAMLTAMRDAVVSVEPIGRPTKISSNFLHGFSTMPVRLTARGILAGGGRTT